MSWKLGENVGLRAARSSMWRCARQGITDDKNGPELGFSPSHNSLRRDGRVNLVDSSKEENTQHMEFGAVCLSCLHTQPPLDSVAAQYFEGKPILCRNAECGKPVDYWEATLDFIGSKGIPTILLVSVGARETFFDFPLSAGGITEIDLTKYGIPADATVLGIDFTSQGAECAAQVIHPNLSLRSLKTKFHVYGLPTSETSESKGEINVSATAAWVHNDEDTVSWSYLLDAFEAMASHRWRSVILPAYAAFEISLSPLVLAGLARHVSKTVLESFKGDKSFTSSAALNVLLPILGKEARLPLLPESIRGGLNRLRGLRNKMVHEGVEHAAISQKVAGESLCAAVFGLEYLRYLRPRLLC